MASATLTCDLHHRCADAALRNHAHAFLHPTSCFTLACHKIITGMPPSLRKRSSRASLRSRHSAATSTSTRGTIRRRRVRVALFVKRIVTKSKNFQHRTRRSKSTNDKSFNTKGSHKPHALFRGSPPSSKRTSPLLNLPYDIREQIYLYAFASAKIRCTTWKQEKDWSALALACRKVKTELDKIPMRLLTSPIEATWASSGAWFPIHIITDAASAGRLRVSVRVPRSALMTVSELLCRLSSAVLAFESERTTIALYNDGTPPLNLSHVVEFFHYTQCIIYLRCTLYYPLSSQLTIVEHLIIKAREAVFLWAGHLEYYWLSHESMSLCMPMEIRLDPEIYVPACYVLPRTSYIARQNGGALITYYGMQGIAVSSETRFRREVRWPVPNFSVVKLKASAFQQQYCDNIA